MRIFELDFILVQFLLPGQSQEIFTKLTFSDNFWLKKLITNVSQCSARQNKISQFLSARKTFKNGGFKKAFKPRDGRIRRSSQKGQA